MRKRVDPYPFGVGSGCSLESSFNITCNTSTTPPKPYLNIDHYETLEVVEIISARIRIRYPHPLFGACLDESSGSERRSSEWIIIDFSGTQYTLSDYNWLTAVGCDELMVASSLVQNQSFRDTCIGTCSVGKSSSDKVYCPNNVAGNSVGDGCCRTPIVKGNNH